MSNVIVHLHICTCQPLAYTPDPEFLRLIAEAQAEVAAALDAETVMSAVVGR